MTDWSGDIAASAFTGGDTVSLPGKYVQLRLKPDQLQDIHFSDPSKKFKDLPTKIYNLIILYLYMLKQVTWNQTTQW